MRTLFQMATLALAFGVVAPLAAEDAHHPQVLGQTQAEPAPSQGSAQAPEMGMTEQRNMMDGGMSRMMPMMGMMRMIHGGAYIEGRLAFVKAELKITPAQKKAWDDFANALRQAAAKVSETNAPMPMMSGMATSAPAPQLLEQHEKQLTAQLEAIRIMKPAVGPFYAGLSEEQKRTLAELHPMLHGMF
jgi:hypothetical protein